MAAGTGGHVFPALSIAEQLAKDGVAVEWLGTPTGLENQLLENEPYPLHRVAVSGLRGTGLKRLLFAPLMLLRAFTESFAVIRRVRPDCVLGMGGFVCGPAGVAAWLSGRPLIVHEQNAVAGLTNRLLAPMASRILESFPATFKAGPKRRHTGNPVRTELLGVNLEPRRPVAGEPANLLVLGGSLGAQALNAALPAALAMLPRESWRLWHQTGRNRQSATREHYAAAGVDLSNDDQLCEFIDDMAAAYGWADLVICRAGASTVFELAAVGKPALFIPYPHHRDQQQLHNACWLEQQSAALIIEQENLSPELLSRTLKDSACNPETLAVMTEHARSLRGNNAARAVADQCLEVMCGR